MIFDRARNFFERSCPYFLPFKQVWHFYWQYIAVIVYNNLNFL